MLLEVTKPIRFKLYINFKSLSVMFLAASAGKILKINKVKSSKNFINLVIKRAYSCCCSSKVCKDWSKNSKN